MAVKIGCIAGFLTGSAVVAVLMLLFEMIDSKAAFTLMGIIIGSGISAIVSLLVASENRKQQWELAALDKRLEVHQAAYAMWQRIVSAVYDSDQIGKVVVESKDWWNNNCLYLDAASRRAFRNCLFSASDHKDLLNGPQPRDEETKKMIKENWNTIMKPGETLPAGVALPDLGEQELSLEHTNQSKE